MSGFLVEFSNELANAVERAGSSVISVLEGGREGVSGTIWRNGVAVTAAHTIRGRDEVTVVLPSGIEAKGSITGRDAGTDIAVLKIPEAPAIVHLPDSMQPRVGEIVLSVARRGTEGLAATYGLISAIGGPWHTWQGARIDRWVRLDINPFTGFSGGPVVNASGEAIGMATSGPRRSVQTIPASTVDRVVEEILKHGRVARGYLGVGLQPVVFPEGTLTSIGSDVKGSLLVVAVAQGTPAADSGIMIGDIIVRAEGAPISNMRSLQHILNGENIGKSISLDVVRGGRLLKVSVAVREKPEN